MTLDSTYDPPFIPVAPAPRILRFASPVIRTDGVRGVVIEPPKGQQTFSLVLWFYGGEEGHDGPVRAAADSLYLDLSDRTGVQHALWWFSDELFAGRTQHPHLGCGVSWAPRWPCGNIRAAARGWDSIPGWALTVDDVDEVWSFDARWPDDVEKDDRGTLVPELAGLPAPNDWKADEKIHTEVGMRLVDIEALRRVLMHRLVNVYGYKAHDELYEDDPTMDDESPEYLVPSGGH
jgi:hypothetical protein